MHELKEYVKQDWIWCGLCLCAEAGKQDGLSWRFHTVEGKRTHTSIGQRQNGLLSGLGIVVFSPASKSKFAIGQFANGYLEGAGLYVWRSGNKYVGFYKSGKRSGQGKKITCSGRSYVGDYEHDKPNGWGVSTSPTGAVYEGEMANNRCHGWGRVTWTAIGFQFEGRFSKKGVPEDKWACLHPSLRKAVKADICTATVTGFHSHYGQFYFRCAHCNIVVCCVCWYSCHQHGLKPKGKKYWSTGICCRCPESPKRCSCFTPEPTQKLIMDEETTHEDELSDSSEAKRQKTE